MFGVEIAGGRVGSRGSVCEMGPEGQGQQVRVADQWSLLQIEGTQAGSLEASEKWLQAFAHHSQGFSWSRPFSLPLPLPTQFSAGYAPPMADLMDTDRQWSLSKNGVLSYRCHEASSILWPREQRVEVAIMHSGIIFAKSPRCCP